MKTFADLSDDELDTYLDANVTAVRDLVDFARGASTRRSATTW